MEEKIVVLNSGGFDSIVLIQYIRFLYPEAEIHSLYFSYGELNSEQQQKCIEKVCAKVNATNYHITLPKFSWTKGKFYDTEYEYEAKYLEYRNMVFIAYAVSYAESIGADKIYVATLMGALCYKDNSMNFYIGINTAISESKINVIAPFSGYIKEDLKPFIRIFNIKEDDFFSCDVPKDHIPCGVCDKCLDIKKLFNNAS